MQSKYLCLALIFSLVPCPVFGEGIPIEPGMWEMTTTTNIPMMPQPNVSTTMECIEEGELSPQTMTDEAMDSDCTFDTMVVDGNTMQWSMHCSAPGGASRGVWEATSNGDTLTGGGTVSVDMQGQTMTMAMQWDGKRVGDCD